MEPSRQQQLVIYYSLKCQHVLGLTFQGLLTQVFVYVEMKVWIYSVVFAVSSLAVSSQTCPSDHLSAIFVGIQDQTVDDRSQQLLPPKDTELYFFRNVLKLRDSDIQHVGENALRFFNYTFGLDFSASIRNDQHELIFENAVLFPYKISDEINFYVATNNWIRTGNTHSTCNRIRHGGFRVSFTGDQTLYGSYGGAEGKPAGMLFYGFFHIDVCQQSPVIIQFQSSTPFRVEPVDGIGVLNLDLYNKVLGYGKSQSFIFGQPDKDEPSKYRIMARNVFTFPAK